MSRDGPSETTPNYEDWPVEGRPNATYIGMMEDGTHGVYDSNEDQLLSVEAADGRFEPQGSLSEVEESLGEQIKKLGDSVGWESLSTFAQDHLQTED